MAENMFDKADDDWNHIAGQFLPPPTKQFADTTNYLLTEWFEFINLIRMYFERLIPDLKAWGEAKATDALTARRKDALNPAEIRVEDIKVFVRFGYVHLWHRYETFRNRLFDYVDAIFAAKEDDKVVAYIRTLYGVDLTKNGSGAINKDLAEVNYVSNCVKHSGGYPKDQVQYIPPSKYATADPKKMITPTPQELLDHMHAVKEFTFQLFHACTIAQNRRVAVERCVDPMFSALDPSVQKGELNRRDALVKQLDYLWMQGMFPHLPPKKENHPDKIKAKRATHVP